MSLNKTAHDSDSTITQQHGISKVQSEGMVNFDWIGRRLVREGEYPPTGGDYIMESELLKPYRIVPAGSKVMPALLRSVPGRTCFRVDDAGIIRGVSVEGSPDLIKEQLFECHYDEAYLDNNSELMTMAPIAWSTGYDSVSLGRHSRQFSNALCLPNREVRVSLPWFDL
ncbi:hypothetical protein PROFUN_03995 [Planoprotostelium fungivorum]|uniref:Uncharacterized protein n=1 Tax=Planoprotostelium fungivorum TaxID=1890364 RepID=A0A2P6NW32_9EUKA|nr:hypothetical protein PROFUN_03995 [Planoprotostelium fungivorum]